MPTILRFGAFRVVIYPNDHDPAHVHVIGGDGEILFYLHCQGGTVSVRERVGISGPDERRIAAFLTENLAILVQLGSVFMVTDEESRAAARRGREKRKRVPHATAARYDARLQRVLIELSDGLELAVDPKRLKGFQDATPLQLDQIELWAAGWEVFFPKLDEGIYVPYLIEGLLSARTWLGRERTREGVASTKADLKTSLAA